MCVGLSFVLFLFWKMINWSSYYCLDHLNNHRNQHTGQSLHKCVYCSKSFSRKGSLIEFCVFYSIKTIIFFYCLEHLKNHQVKHTGISPYQCKFCNKIFSRREHLNNHEMIHTGLSPHKCVYCDKVNRIFPSSWTDGRDDIKFLVQIILIHIPVCLISLAQYSNVCTKKKSHFFHPHSGYFTIKIHFYALSSPI